MGNDGNQHNQLCKDGNTIIYHPALGIDLFPYFFIYI